MPIRRLVDNHRLPHAGARARDEPQGVVQQTAASHFAPGAREPVDVNALTSDVADLLGLWARHRGVFLQFDLGTAVPGVSADASQLRKLWLAWAQQALPSATSSRMLVLRRTWGPHLEGGLSVRLELRFVGWAASADEVAALAASPDIAALAEAMGGGISAMKGAGEDLALSVSLRLPSGEPGAAQPLEPEAARRAPHILVADDIDINRELVAAMLEHLSPTFAFAANGQEAVDLAEQQRFDLIFTDVRMPQLDGVQAVRLIRTQPHGRGLPIIAMVGDVQGEDQSRVLDAGANDVVVKPIRRKRLLEITSRWLAPALLPGCTHAPTET